VQRDITKEKLPSLGDFDLETDEAVESFQTID
jgi:hypothetical protein